MAIVKPSLTSVLVASAGILAAAIAAARSHVGRPQEQRIYER